jgi:branched-chain amino acid aminotransferase
LRPEASVFLSFDELHELPAEVYAQGVRCRLADSGLHRDRPRSKATRFIGPGTAARESASDANEVLLTDPAGHILEGSSSNFFAVLGGVLRTAEQEVLAGVTRGIVLAVSEGVLPVLCLPVTRDDLPTLEEAFITSVSRAVLPLVAIDGTKIGAGVPGPQTRRIMERFSAHIESELEPIA